MSLTVYNGEYFNRSQKRFISFFIVVAVVIIGSFLSKNRIGGVMILLFVGGYFFFLTKTNKNILLQIQEKGLQIEEKLYEREQFSGYVLEYHLNTQKIHNIVFLSPRGHMIFTIHDSDEQLELFLQTLNGQEKLERKDHYEQTIREKISRKLKL